jgi:putative DNA primase/helicase
MYREASDIEDKTERTNLVKWALTSESKKNIEAMIALAKSERGIPIVPDELDKDTYLLNCTNGTIDLRTGKLKKHRQSDLITRRIEVIHNPIAICPTWQTFLKRIFENDQELITYVQRCVGYTLTGSTDEQCMFFAYGTGKNGKSTFFETLIKLMSGYAMKAPTEMLMLKKHDGISNDVARIAGSRLVVASEVQEGKRLSESLLKDLTGGDTIPARFLYKETFEFEPTHKLWMYGNHKPEIRGTDPGIWRRIRVIPFSVHIPPEEVDPKLKQKLLQELPGILLWAIDGCIDHQKYGLVTPQAVTKATQQYRTEMDILAAFIDDCCTTMPKARVKAGDLYKVYVNWCDENGENAISQRRLGQKLDERGFIRQRTGIDGAWYRLGLGLLSDHGKPCDDLSHDPTDPTDPISRTFPHEQDSEKVLEVGSVGSVGSCNSATGDKLPPPGAGKKGEPIEQQIGLDVQPSILERSAVFLYWRMELEQDPTALERLQRACQREGWNYQATVELLRASLEKEGEP